jgi:hypothetical protein
LIVSRGLLVEEYGRNAMWYKEPANAEPGGRQGQRENGNEEWIYSTEIVDMAILARECSFLCRNYKRES